MSLSITGVGTLGMAQQTVDSSSLLCGDEQANLGFLYWDGVTERVVVVGCRSGSRLPSPAGNSTEDLLYFLLRRDGDRDASGRFFSRSITSRNSDTKGLMLPSSSGSARSPSGDRPITGKLKISVRFWL